MLLVLFLATETDDDDGAGCCTMLAQSCPWVGLTRGLGWVGLGIGRKFLFLVGLVGSWV